MKTSYMYLIVLLIPFTISSCVTQKKYTALQAELTKANELLHSCNEQKDLCRSDLKSCRSSVDSKQEMNAELRAQLADCKTQRDKQLSQVGDLTVLSKSANDNIAQTLAQLEKKDKYIQLLQAAK